MYIKIVLEIFLWFFLGVAADYFLNKYDCKEPCEETFKIMVLIWPIVVTFFLFSKLSSSIYHFIYKRRNNGKKET